MYPVKITNYYSDCTMNIVKLIIQLIICTWVVVQGS